MSKIACVGILVADVITKPVDQLPEKGKLQLVDSIELFSGGNAMTASLNLKTLGCSSAVIGKIGRDPLGDFLRRKLLASGVDVRGLAEDSNSQTSASVALSSADGERTFLHCIGANGTFGLDDINWDVISESEIVFVTGSFLLDRFDGAQTAEFLSRCKREGKKTALDVCWDSRGRWGSVLDQAMPYIDYFLPSYEEAVMLAGKEDGTPPEELARVFFEKGVQSVVIKWGSHGCYAQESARAPGMRLPTYTGIKPVDTTGAGDSFCSGFLAACSRGEAFLDCARFANAAGTHCIMARGATTGMKSYETIKRFMEEYENELGK